MNSNIILGIVLLALGLFLKPIMAIVGLNEKLFGLHWQGETVFSLSPLSRKRNENDGQDYIPRGFYLIQEETAYEILKGSIIINIKDLINSNHHSDSSRLNGC